MAPPTTCWAPEQTSPVSAQCQLSITKYQVGYLSKLEKSPFEWLTKKNGVLAVSKLKSMKVTADLCLDKAGLLVIAHTWQEATYSLQSAVTQHSWNGKGTPEKPRPLVSLPTFSDLLWWPPQGLANSAQNVSLNERFINKFVSACSIVFILLW